MSLVPPVSARGRAAIPPITWRRRASALALSAGLVGLLTGLFEPRIREARAAVAVPHGRLPGADRAVCPLTDADATAAIDAFAKLTPLFNQEPRCVNCHGGLNIAATNSPTTHPGGTFGPDSLDAMERGGPSSPCFTCHSNAKEWRIPTNDKAFAGRDALTLCHQMKRQLGEAGLARHLDNDATGLVDVGFQGTRALNEAGQSLALGKSYAPDPPKNFTKPQAVELAKIWDRAASRRETAEIDDCGCKPLHYALRVEYLGTILPNNPMRLVMWRSVKPVDIPITFIDSAGRLTGHAEAAMVDTGGSIGCRVDGHQTADLTLTNGRVDPDPSTVQHGVLRADISSPPTAVKVKTSCQTAIGSDGGSRRGGPQLAYEAASQGQAPLFRLDLPAVVGADTTITQETQTGVSRIHVTLLEVSPKK